MNSKTKMNKDTRRVFEKYNMESEKGVTMDAFVSEYSASIIAWLIPYFFEITTNDNPAGLACKTEEEADIAFEVFKKLGFVVKVWGLDIHADDNVSFGDVVFFQQEQDKRNLPDFFSEKVAMHFHGGTEPEDTKYAQFAERLMQVMPELLEEFE